MGKNISCLPKNRQAIRVVEEFFERFTPFILVTGRGRNLLFRNFGKAVLLCFRIAESGGECPFLQPLEQPCHGVPALMG
ncbi:hypothetical protein [Prevotella intermedia]|uniref:hypothetical protein n=1 Tax=Prevotella intermedia TaxID=28131 RepID=UPI001180E275|nr:hypothetical protein [Prevotella intermedia]